MNELEEHIPLDQKAEEKGKFKKVTKRHNPGLRALLSVKHFTLALEDDYAELLKIEDELQKLNLNALVIIEANVSLEVASGWKVIMSEINRVVASINTVITSAKEKSVPKEKDDYTMFWKQLTTDITELKSNFKNAANTGLNLLPEMLCPQWEKEFVNLEVPLVESLIAYVESCRILLQMIERYTPDELNAITQIIADNVPLDFTYEEAMEYQNDYYKALINFKKEFKKEKNLWDKFLDILAGGTHQSPSERVMMERWLDGEKGDL